MFYNDNIWNGIVWTGETAVWTYNNIRKTLPRLVLRKWGRFKAVDWQNIKKKKPCVIGTASKLHGTCCLRAIDVNGTNKNTTCEYFTKLIFTKQPTVYGYNGGVGDTYNWCHTCGSPPPPVSDAVRDHRAQTMDCRTIRW